MVHTSHECLVMHRWCCSVAELCPTLCDLMNCTLPGSLSSSISQNLLKFMSTESVMLFNHCILCRLLLLLPSVFPSIRVFSSELSPHIRWPKYWSFSISPSNKYSVLISFRTDWFDLFAVQGTLKSSAPQFESTNSSMLSLLYCPAFTFVQCYSNSHSHPQCRSVPFSQPQGHFQ